MKKRSAAQRAAAKNLELGRQPGPRTVAQAANLVRAQKAAQKTFARRRAAAGGESCPRCGGVAGHPYKHGSSGYLHGCKCDTCMAWMRESGQRKYYANLERSRARAKARYDADPERHQAYQRKWAADNPERAKEVNHQSYLKRRVLGWVQDPRPRKRSNQRGDERRRLIPNPRDGVAWTPEEDAIAMQDLSLVAICYRIGRSYDAVQQRRARLRK